MHGIMAYHSGTWWTMHCYCAPGRHGRGLWRACLFVCLCMLSIAVAWSSSGGVVIHYVLPVSQIMSYLHIIGRMEEACRYRCSKWRHCIVVHRLTSLQLRVGCFMSWTLVGTETGLVHRARGAEAELAEHHCLVLICGKFSFSKHFDNRTVTSFFCFGLVKIWLRNNQFHFCNI